MDESPIFFWKLIVLTVYSFLLYRSTSIFTDSRKVSLSLISAPYPGPVIYKKKTEKDHECSDLDWMRSDEYVEEKC